MERGELQARPISAKLRDAQSLEVSLTGLFIATSDPLPVGSVLTVHVRVSEGAPPLTVLARVEGIQADDQASGRAAGMALAFLDVWGKGATEQVARYLDEANASASAARPSFRGLRVLVVDDNDHYRDMAARAMREAGFDVITAVNGFEGLSAALKHQPSVILSDVTMPGMDGWQLLRMVRARPTLRRTPLLFLTDLSSDEQRLRGYELGVDDYVSKPFTMAELTARVERVIERAQIADEGGAHGMRGDLAKVPITSLLAFAEMERRSAVLQLLRSGERATLHLRDGAVMRIDLGAEHDDLNGLARFFHVLDWEAGRFELTAADVLVDDDLGLPTSFALLEHARRRDEAGR